MGRTGGIAGFAWIATICLWSCCAHGRARVTHCVMSWGMREVGSWHTSTAEHSRALKCAGVLFCLLHIATTNEEMCVYQVEVRSRG